MAISIAKASTWPVSRTVVAEVTLDASYPTGGYSLAASDLGMQSIASLVAHATGGYVFEYIHSTAKLKAFRQKDPAAAGGADIVLPEVANATNLSAVVLHVTALGS